MSLRDNLATVIARDSRYSIQGYLFLLEALETTRTRKKKRRAKKGTKGRKAGGSPGQHVSGRDLCEGVRSLAMEHYGLMAVSVLNDWGIRSTGDIGEIVENLIASGDLERSSADSRADFDDVFDFDEALRQKFDLPPEDDL